MVVTSVRRQSIAIDESVRFAPTAWASSAGSRAGETPYDAEPSLVLAMREREGAEANAPRTTDSTSSPVFSTREAWSSGGASEVLTLTSARAR